MFNRVQPAIGGVGGGSIIGASLLRLNSSSFDENSTTAKTVGLMKTTPSTTKRRAFGDISNRKEVRDTTNNNSFFKQSGGGVGGVSSSAVIKPQNNKSVSFATPNANAKTPFGTSRRTTKKSAALPKPLPFKSSSKNDATIPPRTPSRTSALQIGSSKTPSSVKTVFRSSTTAAPVPKLKQPEIEFDEIKSAGRGWDKWHEDDDDDDSVLSLDEFVMTFSEMKRDIAKQRKEKRQQEEEEQDRQLRIQLEELALADRRSLDVPAELDDVSYGSIDLCLAFDEEDDPAMERYSTDELLW
uniref:Uncharacterized protein n=1 Tax=Grammatophora oceanica TaxID=210454 RepID=A0A7S1YKB6_9STRA|mmetsp:Transcript_7540/g.11051  ORF Transcript_7540/g.11051 Transcript_7540/m.11051 type:complete len:298 (+) Transcript_7540:184-1077(+)